METGRDVYMALSSMAQVKGKKAKCELLVNALQSELFRQIITYGLNQYITFGVTVDATSPVGTPGGLEITLADTCFWGMLDELASRRLTGNAARERVAHYMNTLSVESAAVLGYIINKDFRAGFHVTSVNSALPGFLPEFFLMLAHPYAEHRVVYPVAVEPKIDGMRTATTVRVKVPISFQEEVLFQSRAGNEFLAYHEAFDEVLSKLVIALEAEVMRQLREAAPGSITHKLMKVFKNNFLTPLAEGEVASLVFDGEMCAKSFNGTVSEGRRKSKQAKETVYYIFDALPAAAFKDPTCNEIKLPYRVRLQFRNLMKAIVEASPELSRRLIVLEAETARTPNEITDIYGRFRAAGYEGAIVKSFDAGYVKDRNYAWMKLKAEETIDLPVIGAFEGTGKYAGMLGGFVVNKVGTKVNVGSGFTDKQRQELWAEYVSDPANFLGRVMEIKFQEETADGSLRHPRFHLWRDDKGPADLLAGLDT